MPLVSLFQVLVARFFLHICHFYYLRIKQKYWGIWLYKILSIWISMVKRFLLLCRGLMIIFHHRGIAEQVGQLQLDVIAVVVAPRAAVR